MIDIKAKQAKSAEKKAKRKSNAAFIRKTSGKPKLPSIKRLKAILWNHNTEIVEIRDGRCIPCFKQFGLVHPGFCQNHVIPQCEAPHMAYDLDNIVWGCKTANASEKFNRAFWATNVWPQVVGAEKYAELRNRRNATVQIRRPDWMDRIAEAARVKKILAETLNFRYETQNQA